MSASSTHCFYTPTKGAKKMSSSYSKIYSLLRQSDSNPYEDYLTEIVAPIFEQPDLLTYFFKRFANVDFSEISRVKAYTQKTYSKLHTHDTDSRPDLVITFSEGDTKHLVFIENKLGSGEGLHQLKRYREHLEQSEEEGFSTYLFYITQYFDPKHVAPSSTKFFQLQWFQLYIMLQEYNKQDLYYQQVLKYMEDIELNKSRTFLPQDVYAIQNLGRTISMLDQCLNEKTTHTFTNLFGKPKPWGNRAIELRDYNRYVIQNDQSDWKFIGCGFSFEQADYPEVSVYIEVHPNSKHRTVLIDAFKQFAEVNEGWVYEAPEDRNDWFMLYADQSLTHFLSAPDHIDAIETFFIQRLEKLNELKQSLSQLNWIVVE